MRGVITGRDALKNLPLICVEFGMGCAFRVLTVVLRRQKKTFLEVVFKVPSSPELHGPEHHR